jgi:mRNA interferase RelE/StbE
MRYSLRFHELALKEWEQLDHSIREAFKKKLATRLKNPRLPSAALRGMPDCYKIKLLQAGYRLIYRVEDNAIRVTVIAVGKRDKCQVYTVAKSR